MVGPAGVITAAGNGLTVTVVSVEVEEQFAVVVTITVYEPVADTTSDVLVAPGMLVLLFCHW